MKFVAVDKRPVFEQRMIEAVREVFSWPELAPVMTVDGWRTDWRAFDGGGGLSYPRGRWIMLDTFGLRPDTVACLQAEMNISANEQLRQLAVNPEKYKFFPVRIGRYGVGGGPRIVVRWDAVRFLVRNRIKINLEPSFTKIYGAQNDLQRRMMATL